MDIDSYYESLKDKLPITYEEYSLVSSKIKPIVKNQAINKQLLEIREEIIVLSSEVNYHQRKEIAITLNNIDSDDDEYNQHFDKIQQAMIEGIKELLPNAIL